MMYIANPVYDAVFKYMLEDEDVAKRFIGIIINKKIVSLELKPQEKTYHAEHLPVAVQRLDFVAQIVDENGQTNKVLIEIQKSNKTYHADILRFRGYLAKHYQTDDLPIITIYILGFTLKDLNAPAVYASPEYKDLYYDKKIEQKCEFIDKLTHSTYIIQVPRLKLTVKKKLAELLDLFNQQYRVSQDVTGSRILKIPFLPKDKDIQKIAKRLEKAGADESIREKIANEEMAEMMYEEMFGDKDKKIIQLEQQVEKKEKALNEKEEQLKQEKQRAEQLEQEKIITIQKLIEKGFSVQEIIEIARTDLEFLKKHKLI